MLQARLRHMGYAHTALIIVYYGSATAAECRVQQRELKTAAALPPIQGMCNRRWLRNTINVSSEPTHPSHPLFQPPPPRKSSALLGILSTRIRNVCMGMFDHSSRRAFVKRDTDVGREGLAHSLRSNSSQRCSAGLRSGHCTGQSSTNSLIHVFMDLPCALVRRHVGTVIGHNKAVPTKLEFTEILR